LATLEWVACNASTGVVIANLPGLIVPSVQDAMMSFATATATLVVTDRTDPEWVAATRPGGAYIVLLEDSVPTWGGLIASRRKGTNDLVSLSLGTVATYLRRRFVGDTTFTDEDQCAIVEQLVALYGETDGLPFEYDVTASAITRDRTYLDLNDKTVMSAISELAGVENGPEWAITWTTKTVGTQTAYCPKLVVADRLGSTPAAGLGPSATWEFPGAVVDVELTEDYSDGKGANDVMAVSTASMDTRPESVHVLVTDDERPKFEHRFTPSTTITETDTLDAHAARQSAQVGRGTLTLAMTLDAASARPGIDFNLGDVRGFRIGGDAHPLLAYPGGVEGTARVIGYTRTFGSVPQVTPVLSALEVTRGRF